MSKYSTSSQTLRQGSVLHVTDSSATMMSASDIRLNDWAATTMKAYVSAKFAGDDNEETIEHLCQAAERAGFTVTCTIRDYDDFGRDGDQVEPLVEYIFAKIEEAEIVLIDVTDKGMGLGVEAGYAVANDKPVVLLVTHDADVSPIMEKLALRIIPYQGFEDLTQQLSALRTAQS
ncbi:hypothetical protein HY524_00815 [Candidatus Berkelbacteria bacterium]|nr:hypothetical protein [Candidatus Berkelbacteria bacterium]